MRLLSLEAWLAFASSVSAAFKVSGAPPLFPGEAIQLSQESLRNASRGFHNDSRISLFEFGWDSQPSHKKSPALCKLLPGDAAWPSPSTWDVFNFLLGGSLISGTPLAAVCYPSWPEYSPQECEDITNNWFAADLQ